MLLEVARVMTYVAEALGCLGLVVGFWLLITR